MDKQPPTNCPTCDGDDIDERAVLSTREGVAS